MENPERVRKLRALASAIVGDVLCDDVLQEARIRLGTLESKQAPRTVRNIAINMLAGEEAHGRAVAELGLSTKPPASNLSLTNDVRKALIKLPSRERSILVWYFIEGWTYQEIAQHLKLSIGWVYELIGRGRARLRALLDDYKPGGVSKRSRR